MRECDLRGLCWAQLLTLLLVAGCGGETDDETVGAGGGEPAACETGDRRADDGSCMVPGLPADAACPPGSALAAEDCVAAGIPPDGCADGFVHDGIDGCDPVLPAQACPDAAMAIVGEIACRAVADCGSAPWGGIAIDATTVFVDASYAGGDGDGSQDKPFTSVQEGVDQAPAGAVVAVTDGSYVESVDVEGKAVVLWGRCPELVTITGPPLAEAAVRVLTGASGTVVRSLALTGEQAGLLVTGSQDVVADQLWIHDTGYVGAFFHNGSGDTSGTVRGSLIERASRFAAASFGAELTFEESVARATALRDAKNGYGLYVGPTSNNTEPPSLTVTRSVISDNHNVGILVESAHALIDASVIRDTVVDAFGYGLYLRAGDLGAAASMTIQGSVVEGIADIAVNANSGTLSLKRTVVRDSPVASGNNRRGIDAYDPDGTAPAVVTVEQSVIRGHRLGLVVTGTLAIDRSVVRDNLERGLSADASDDTGEPTTLEITSSVFANNAELAMQLPGTHATIRDTVIRDSLMNASGNGGRAMELATHDDFHTPTVLDARGLLIERCHEVAILLASSEMTLAQSHIRDIIPTALHGGRAMQLQQAPFTADIPSRLTVSSTLFEELGEVGVMVIGSHAIIEDSRIRQVAANSEGLLGDGMALIAETALETSAEVRNVLIEDSARAGMSNFGGALTLQGVQLMCQGFDLHTETWNGRTATIQDLGDNRCGCPLADGECKAVSAGFQPPAPL